MEHFESIEHEGTYTYDALRVNSNERILAQFSEHEQQEILSKLKILSLIAYFIGKDFQIPVELNEPGEGWHWDFKENKIRVDPKDLLEKPMDYLRFVIAHEGGHRRISRTGFIPLEEWRQPGFSFMMNAIEDPRDNNFVAENYPKFKEHMKLAYEHDFDVEQSAKKKAKERLGYQPRFMQAGFEYIKQWYRESLGEEFLVSEDLSEDVKVVVNETLNSAQDSWLRYPSRNEADDAVKGEEYITAFAKVSYEINRDEVWPAFKTLVEQDMEDQKMQEFMKGMEQEKMEGREGAGLPQEMKDKLTPEEQEELEDAIEKALEEAKKKQEEMTSAESGKEDGEGSEGAQEEGGKSKSGAMPIDLDALSPELKQKVKEYLDSLPEDKKKEFEDKAKESLEEFGKDIGEEIGGKLSENPEKVAQREDQGGEKDDTEGVSEQENVDDVLPEKRESSKELEEYRRVIAEKLNMDENRYEECRREVLPIIDKLENELRDVFVARRAHAWQSGFKTGKRIDIKKRMQEKAKGISAVESVAWKRRELPSEKDYAISLLVDLSGSMQGKKIEETFKAVVVLAEVLNRLSILTEVLGFNDRIYAYQEYGEQMSKEIREAMGGMLKEVSIFNQGGPRAGDNDDGWALMQASERLAQQKVDQKFLVVLSDGVPAMDSRRKSKVQLDRELREAIAQIIKDTDQKLIGLGIGQDTNHVEDYYPKSIANVNVEEMADKLANLLRDIIEHYDEF